MPSHLPHGILSAFSLALAAWALPARAADYSAWSDVADVNLDTGPGANEMGLQVLGYPLLVRLRAPTFSFARAQGRGQDLRFTNAWGEPLPHEIETWDSAAGRADVWVRVDTVKALQSAQGFRMYWGNPAAADTSDPGAVFPAGRSLVAAWHLGGTSDRPRPNAVPGAHPAVPVNFDGDESRPGVIGSCDSLGSDGTADWFDAGAGYADWTTGFTYTAWVKPSAVRTWGRLMDFGNGAESDNIVLGRDAATSNLAVHVYPGVGNVHSRLNTGAFFTLDQWQHVAVTVNPADSAVNAYRNGAPVWTGKLIAPIRNVNRTLNWLGRSHWAADQYWQGAYDEVRLHRRALEPARVKLDYDTQREGASAVRIVPRANCAARFAVPADSVVDEGSPVTLTGTADCASRWSWSVVGGLPLRLIDPSAKDQALQIPRVVGDTQVTLQFLADMPDSQASSRVTVRIREAVPDPLFTLPDSAGWGGADSLVLTPAFTNLAAVRASRDSVITLEWTVERMELDTSWRGYSLVLRRPASAGVAVIRVCASNGGPSHCATTMAVATTSPTTLVPTPGAPVPAGKPFPGTRGRLRPDGRRLDPASRHGFPGFPMP